MDRSSVILDLTSTYGPIVIGGYLSWAFWGINVMQTYVGVYCGQLERADRLAQLFLLLEVNKSLNATFSGLC